MLLDRRELPPRHRHHGWLDTLAVSMAVICAIHCLLLPVLIIALPIIAATFFAHHDFHFWMLFLVLPTSVFAVTLGCRRHKDWAVGCLSALGLLLMVIAVVIPHDHAGDHLHGGGALHASELLTGPEEVTHAHHDHDHAHHDHDHAHHDHHGEHGAVAPPGAHHPEIASFYSAASLLTTLGGLLLITGHIRNFRLCRRDRCSHQA